MKYGCALVFRKVFAVPVRTTLSRGGSPISRSGDIFPLGSGLLASGGQPNFSNLLRLISRRASERERSGRLPLLLFHLGKLMLGVGRAGIRRGLLLCNHVENYE
jgi:hypothetical protein